MTCDMMLVAMLDAGADELAGEASTPLAQHVRSCAKCGAVAQRLLGETRALARGLSYKPIPDLGAFKASRPRPAVVVAASVMSLAAAILIFVGVRYSMEARLKVGQIGTGTMTANAVQALPSRKPATARDAARDVRPLGVSLKPRVTEPSPYVASAAVATPYAAAVAVAAPAANEPADDAVVTVDPPAGRRATVMRGSHPSVTVVWLTDISSR